MKEYTKNKKMSLLQVPVLRFPEVKGGVDTMVLSLVDALWDCGRLTVLVPGGWENHRLEKRKYGNINVYVLRLRLPFDPRRPILGFLGWLVEMPRTVYLLKRLLADEGIDLIHLHMAKDWQFYFRILRWLGGAPYLVTFHRGDVVEFDTQNYFSKKLIRWMLKGAAKTNAVSHWLARRSEEQFPEVGPVTCVHNGLNIADTKATVAAEVTLNLPELYFVMVGSFDPYKGHDVAIKAWGIIRRKIPSLHLVVIGDGDLRDYYEELMDSFDCRKNVHLIGQQSRSEALAIVKNSLGMIFPSRNEGLGYVLLEAGALEVPVICTRVAPLTEVVIEDESGLLVAPESQNEIAASVEKLYYDPELRAKLGKNLCSRVNSFFSIQNMVEGYLEIYKKII